MTEITTITPPSADCPCSACPWSVSPVASDGASQHRQSFWDWFSSVATPPHGLVCLVLCAMILGAMVANLAKLGYADQSTFSGVPGHNPADGAWVSRDLRIDRQHCDALDAGKGWEYY